MLTWNKEEDKKELEQNWQKVMLFFKQVIGKKPADLKGVLFLIGVQELGKGKETFSKEEKQDLIHIATCKVLSYGGFYTLEGIDTDGWPHWKLEKELPAFDLMSQETLLKHYVVMYFKNEIGLHI